MDTPRLPTDERRPDIQFRVLVEHCLVGMAIVQDDRFLYVNPTYCGIFGYTRDELLQRIKPLDLVADADRTLVADNMRARLQGTAPRVEYVFKGKRKDGSTVYVEILGAVMKIGGRPALMASLMDVSDRKLAAEKIREDETQFRALVEQSVTGIFVILADMTIAYVNPHFTEMLGFSHEEVIGRPLLEFVAEANRPEVISAVRKLVSGKVQSIQLAAAIKRKDGGLADLLAHGTAASFRGQPAIFAVAMDITERKQAEKAQRTSEEKYHSLFEATRDAIMTLEPPSWKFTSANPAAVKMFGAADEEEFISHPPWESSPERQPDGRTSAEKAMEMIESGMREGSHFFDWTHRRMDGVEFPADVLLTRIQQGGRVMLHATVRDISERKQGEQTLLRVNRALKTVSQGDEVLIRATNQESLFREMCRVIVETGGYRMAWIGRAENDPGKILRPVSHAGYEAGYLTLAKISWADDERGWGPAGTAIRSREVQVIQDIANDTRMAPWRVEALKRGYASVIALPLQNAGSMLGVLSLYASEPNGFGSEEVSLLTELAGDLSYGVTALRIRDDRLVGLQRLERAMEDTVQAIASTLEMRDAYTAGHQRRVAVISQAIAKEMGLSDDRIHGLRLATIVHDLGKINIPAEILNRPGKLSAIEFAFIKTHPQVGYDILKPVEFPWPIADIVLQHHERLDGSGYPNGLKGDAILLEARILAVADVVESMTSHRPYRPALGLDVALAEIQEGSGKLYDPVVVEACVKLVRGGKLILSD
jgi:PAS domain S-box-containing protein